MKAYELLESPSELRIRVRGPSIEVLFRNALLAMFEVIEPLYCENSREHSHTLYLSSADRDALLIDFLSQALYLSDVNNEAYFKATFARLDENTAEVMIIGKKIKGFAVEIKAVTHHGALIRQNGQMFATELTFDI